jgi:hypothetical protein
MMAYTGSPSKFIIYIVTCFSLSPNLKRIEFSPILRYYYTMKKQTQKRLHKKMKQADDDSTACKIVRFKKLITGHMGGNI